MTLNKSEASRLRPLALSIVVVNWNGAALLKRCIDSLRRSNETFHEVIVVDNGSTDTSLAACEGHEGVVVIRNGRNLGFGAACNIGARAARGSVLLFLNPDCEVGPGSIARCMNELNQADVGACGIALTNAQGSVARSCHRFPTLASFVHRIFGLHVLSRRFGDGAMTEWDHRQDAAVDHVIGAFYLIRRDLFDQLGGFDERFFVYLEDLDLSLRIHQSGLRIRFLATPTSFHLGGGLSKNIKARRLFYATRSRILYAYKHFPRSHAHLHLALTLFVEPLTRSVQALGRLSANGLAEGLHGLAMVWCDLPSILRRARHR